MLYIFDLDGTLVETYGTDPVPGVDVHLEQLITNGHQLAIATNQAGLAWRIRTQQEKYPTPASMGERFDIIVENLPVLRHASCYMSIYDPRVQLTAAQYAKLVSETTKAIRAIEITVSAKPNWRKPQGGMLQAICKAYETPIAEVNFIGDLPTDAEAAAAVSMHFLYAADFFR